MKKRELVVATTNKGKLREIKELLKDLCLTITSLDDYPKIPPIDETGTSFRENALIKAQTVAEHTGKLTLGEDSGLEVRYLDNAPGIYSARFSGPKATDSRNNQKLLRKLKGVPKSQRKARYRCCAALTTDEEIVAVVSGTCQGLITTRARGRNGFGYDPYFLIPRYEKTFGELDPAVKAKISHRARALKKIKKSLQEYFG